MKYQIGDILRVISCKHGHKFFDQELIVVLDTIGDFGYICNDLSGYGPWAIDEDEVVLHGRSLIQR